GSNARLGSGEWLVAEADESDASFLCLTPVIALVTNIDEDHMDTYGHDFNKLKQAFVDFLMRLPFYGKAVLCADDANLMSIVDRVPRSVILYGESEKAQVRAVNIRAEGTGMRFTVVRENRPDLDIFLSHPGIHSVKNALGAIAVGGLLGIKDDVFVRAFAGFKGVGRRFTQLGEIEIDGGTFTLIDDYGHHPREMAATIAAARGAFPGRRIVLAFQPHRFTRTRDCFEDFVGILSSVDALVLTEVYPAGEAPIPGADARSLARAVRAAGQERLSFAPTIDEVIPTIMKTARPGDVVLTVGAGSIGKIASRLKAGER
ncbi:MAG TPA: UDP-N-acetylmuramate--L-alanine ligase, partial [Sutterella sp.]|nr:UDP-N-acetylmuramate--L-alanine ligase [Sutterella sp.]